MGHTPLMRMLQPGSYLSDHLPRLVAVHRGTTVTLQNTA